MLKRYPLRFAGYSQVRKMSDLKLKVCPCSSHNLGYYTLVSTLPSIWKVSKLRREVGETSNSVRPSIRHKVVAVYSSREVHFIFFLDLSSLDRAVEGDSNQQ
jgi:hypothetical protein